MSCKWPPTSDPTAGPRVECSLKSGKGALQRGWGGREDLNPVQGEGSTAGGLFPSPGAAARK